MLEKAVNMLIGPYSKKYVKINLPVFDISNLSENELLGRLFPRDVERKANLYEAEGSLVKFMLPPSYQKKPPIEVKIEVEEERVFLVDLGTEKIRMMGEIKELRFIKSIEDAHRGNHHHDIKYREGRAPAYLLCERAKCGDDVIVSC